NVFDGRWVLRSETNLVSIQHCAARQPESCHGIETDAQTSLQTRWMVIGKSAVASTKSDNARPARQSDDPERTRGYSSADEAGVSINGNLHLWFDREQAGKGLEHAI